jgi:hypothetical protein
VANAIRISHPVQGGHVRQVFVAYGLAEPGIHKVEGTLTQVNGAFSTTVRGYVFRMPQSPNGFWTILFDEEGQPVDDYTLSVQKKGDATQIDQVMDFTNDLPAPADLGGRVSAGLQFLLHISPPPVPVCPNFTAYGTSNGTKVSGILSPCNKTGTSNVDVHGNWSMNFYNVPAVDQILTATDDAGGNDAATFQVKNGPSCSL